jgi:4-amino-4-deoxy-L-arabinose transferase-like glycosyltransferase
MRRRRALQPTSPPLSPLPARPGRLPGGWRWAVTVLFAAYLALGAVHLVVTPVLTPEQGSFINAPDEAAHLAYVRALAVRHRIPRRDDTAYRTYQWHQPPLYYVLAVPFYGAGARGVRLLSLLLGAAGLWVIYLAARLLFADDPPSAVLALGMVALLPMRQALMASVSNDPLTELLFSVSIYLWLLWRRRGLTPWRASASGAVIGAALLTKASGLLLLPLAAVAAALLWRQDRSARAAIGGGVLCVAVAVLLASGWYARNLRLYHEVTPVRAFAREFERTSKAADWIGVSQVAVDHTDGRLVPDGTMTGAGYAALVADWTFRTFWASYTPLRAATQGIPFFLPPPFYVLCAAVCMGSAIGLVIGVRARARPAATRGPERHDWALLGTAAALVLAAFVGFVLTYFQTQGRYLYPALLPLAMMGACGYRSLFPPRYRSLASGLLLGLLFVLSLAFLFAGVLPAYTS